MRYADNISLQFDGFFEKKIKVSISCEFEVFYHSAELVGIPGNIQFLGLLFFVT